MASSVEVASTAPFGCVLRDHNRTEGRRNRCNDRSPKANFVISDSPAPDDKKSRDSQDSSALSRRQTQVLDRWAARQAREIVSTMEKETEIFSPTTTTPWSEMPASPPSNDNSPAASEGSGKTLNRGASSLVQIWEARLNHRQLHSPNADLTVCTSRSSSGFTASDVGSSPELHTNDQDSFADSPQEQKQPSSGRSMDEREREKEKVRVADIIRRLTDHDHEPSPHEYCSPCAPDPRLVMSSPRPIRGRQAFTDMLMNMERARRAELNALEDRHVVSKFPHRGRTRIQSMLKLRAMQRGKVGPDQSLSPSPVNLNLPPSSSSSIMHLRERFNKRTGPNENCNARSSVKEQIKDTQRKEGSCNGYEPPSSTTSSVSQRREDHCEETRSCSDETRRGTKTHPNISKLQEIVTSAVVSQTTVDVPEQGKSKALSVIPIPIPIPHTQETVTSSLVSQDHRTWKESGTTSSEVSHPNVVETETITLSVHHCVSQTTEDVDQDVLWQAQEDVSVSVIDDGYESEVIEEAEAYEQHQSLDWINDISRPRSFWEERRQEWYKEMLNNTSNDEEITQLIKRKTVSSFLGSALRERMDRLMVSHHEIQTNEELDEDTTPRTMEQIRLSCLQRNAHVDSSDRDRDRGEEEEDGEGFEEEEGTSSQQLPSPVVREWDLPSESPPFYQGGRQSRNTEMELIYDLKSHMEQMHHEMSELRSTVKSCVDMQSELESFIKQQAVEKGKRSSPSGKSCRVCRENKVDSLLYRCGHMCTCLKCAQHLQCSSGKCPVCQAPIHDVVRAFADS